MYSAPVRHALGFAFVPPVGVDAPLRKMRQMVACLVSYQCRLQVEGAKVLGGAIMWKGQLMQEDDR